MRMFINSLLALILLNCQLATAAISSNFKVTQVVVPQKVTSGESFDFSFSLKSRYSYRNVTLHFELVDSNNNIYPLAQSNFSMLARTTNVRQTEVSIDDALADGRYDLVVSVVSQNNGQQGEVSLLADKINVAVLDLEIAYLPNMAFVEASVANSSFVINQFQSDDDKFNQGEGDIMVNLAVTSLHQSVKDDVSLTANLVVNDQRYPLYMTSWVEQRDATPQELSELADDKTQVTVSHRGLQRTLTVECDDEGECASLSQDTYYGLQLDLRLSEAASEALLLLDGDSLTHVEVILDEENQIREWLDNDSDNIVRIPVMYLHDSEEINEQPSSFIDDNAESKVSNQLGISGVSRASEKEIFRKGFDVKVGSKSKARIKYWIDGQSVYKSGANGVPDYVKVRLKSEVKAAIMNREVTIVGAYATGKVRDANTSKGWLKFKVAGKTLYEENFYLPNNYRTGNYTLYTSKKGKKHKLRKSVTYKKGKKYKKWGGTALVEGGIKGTVGVDAYVKYNAEENMIFSDASPFVSVDAIANAKKSWGKIASFGVSGRLNLAELRGHLYLSSRLQNGQYANATAALDLERKHLAGKIKINAKLLVVKKDWTIMKWSSKFQDSATLFWKHYNWGHTKSVILDNQKKNRSTYKLYIPKSQRSDRQDRTKVKVKYRLPKSKDVIQFWLQCPVYSGMKGKWLNHSHNTSIYKTWNKKFLKASTRWDNESKAIVKAAKRIIKNKTLTKKQLKELGLWGKKYWSTKTYKGGSSRTKTSYFTAVHEDCDIYLRNFQRGNSTNKYAEITAY